MRSSEYFNQDLMKKVDLAATVGGGAPPPPPHPACLVHFLLRLILSTASLVYEVFMVCFHLGPITEMCLFIRHGKGYYYH